MGLLGGQIAFHNLLFIWCQNLVFYCLYTYNEGIEIFYLCHTYVFQQYEYTVASKTTVLETLGRLSVLNECNKIIPKVVASLENDAEIS